MVIIERGFLFWHYEMDNQDLRKIRVVVDSK